MVLPRSLLTHSLSCTSRPASHLANIYIVASIHALPKKIIRFYGRKKIRNCFQKKTETNVKVKHVEPPICSGSSSAHFIAARFDSHCKDSPTRVSNSGRLVREPPTRSKLSLPGVVDRGGEEEERRLHVVLLCLCSWLASLPETHLKLMVRSQL